MKLIRLFESLGLDARHIMARYSEDIDLEQDVYISTDRQLVPNALFDFDIAESGGVIEFNVTSRQ